MPRGSPDWKETAPQKSLEQLCREGNAFGGWGQQAAVGGQNSQLQLWNPSNSGVEAYVYSLDLLGSNAGYVYLVDNSTALTTLVQSGRNRKLGGTGSALTIRKTATAMPGGTYMQETYIPANTRVPVAPGYIWVPEGKGLLVAHFTVNTTLRVSFLWFEYTEF